MEKNTGFTLTDEEIAHCRRLIKKGRPYTQDDPEPCYFDWIEDDDRSDATAAAKLLIAAGVWTAEDERIAFGPHDGEQA